MNQFSGKKEIVQVGKLLWEKGMVAANEGNLSLKLDNNDYLITPSGVSKGFLNIEDILVLSSSWVSKSITNQRITSESKLHKIIYDNSSFGAVCHAHPPYATSFAASNHGIPSCLLPEMILSIGAIPLVPYGAPSTDKVGENLLPYLKGGYEVFLLQNHGVLTTGETLIDSYYKMEVVEQYARVVHLNILRGDTKFLTQDEINKLNEIRNTYWKKSGKIQCDICGYCKIIKEGSHD